MTSAAAGRLPSFIIGGAPRSGTTWLYKALERHPNVYMAKPMRPEPKFFLVDEVYNLGLDHYADEWFADAPDDAAVGEKSSNYLESSVAAARIAVALPSVRLIFMLREPADRAVSNYQWTRMNGLESESFGRALELEAERERTYEKRYKYSRPHSYFSRGLYAAMLEPYLKLFGSDQIAAFRFEDLSSNPGALLSAVHDFIGVERRPVDAEGLGVVNASVEDFDVASELPSLRARYTEPNRRLAELLGAGFTPWEVAR